LSDPFIFPLGHIAYMPCGKSFWARKNLLRQNCSHPPANAFLIDFGVILRSKIPILRVKARRKMRKCIVVGQFGSAPVRLRQFPMEKDHDHCEFCWDKFAHYPDTLHQGYTTADNYYWICPDCMNDFKEMFKWTICNE